MPLLAFTLDARAQRVEYEEGMNLLEVLREVCGITSVKDGCSPEGVCGCCTVLLDGRPILACRRDPAEVAGREITTLEGISERERRILAESFIAEGAVQCGFCTPGIALRAKALLDGEETIDGERARRALTPHMCRCTGYLRIQDAIVSAARRWRDAGEADRAPAAPRRADYFGASRGLRRHPERPGSRHVLGVGAAAPRYLGAELALGRKPFAADLKVGGMLHAAVVLSAHPRARVVAIDASAAGAMAGVVRVLGAGDVPGQRHVGLIESDWPLFVAPGEETRYVGDVLALVVAESERAARRAAAAVAVDYEVLEPLCTPEQALSADAPQLHPGGNLLAVCAFSRGDVQAELAASEHIVAETFETQRVEHAFLECEACLALREGDTLHVYSQGQGVHEDQRQIAAVLGLEREQVRVVLVSNGGAFGGKEDLLVQGHAALAAWLLGRPVRLVLTREQSLRMHPKRHPMRLELTAGADARGRLRAVRARICGDTGAYASVGAKVLERAAGHACGPYRVPAVDIEARAVHTNNPPCGAMRGFGVNQAAFAIEGILDRLAERVGVDGWEIRSRNLLAPGDAFATGQVLGESCRGLRRCLDALEEVYRGARFAGIALGIKNTGIGNGMEDAGRVELRVGTAGRVLILCGYTEMGQGLFTVLRQVVAGECGLDPDTMEVRAVSEPQVLCGMTTASRATALATRAARRAARALAADLEGHPIEELAGRSYRGEYICDFTTAPGEAIAEPVTHMAYSYAAQVVILDESGRLERVVAAHDVGRAINPLGCAGQIEGSVHMGLGYALSEDFPVSKGWPDSLRLRDLGLLSAKQTPEIEVILIEEPDPAGGYGAKGVGEIGLVPTAAAVAAALYAFDGQRRNRLPMRDSPAARGGGRRAP